MKVGLMFANTGRFATAEGAKELAVNAEHCGFESLWTVEHVVYPEGYESSYPYDESGKMSGTSESPIPDPLIWLTYLAGVTTTLRLATGILILPERNPVVLAKEVATLDALSGGRVELGIGVGWLREEFDALGIPWERRGARTDEYVAALRTLWSGEVCSFDGEFHSWSNIACNPTPANRTVPIVVGGHSPAAAKRAGRLGDGFYPAKGDLPELIDIVRQTAADAGRDPQAIEITAGHPGLFGEDPLAAMAELESLGVSRTVLPAFLMRKDVPGKLAEWSERLELAG